MVHDRLEKSRIKKTKLSLFEEVRTMEVCKRVKPGKETMDIMEEGVKKAGEPYDVEKAAGQHPDHDEWWWP